MLKTGPHTVRHRAGRVTRSALTAMTSNPADANLKPFLNVLPGAVFYPQTDPAWPTVEDTIKHQIGAAVEGRPSSTSDRATGTREGPAAPLSDRQGPAHRTGLADRRVLPRAVPGHVHHRAETGRRTRRIARHLPA